jgi:hypothetical protein
VHHIFIATHHTLLCAQQHAAFDYSLSKKSLNMDRFRALSLFQPSNLNGAIGAADYEGSHERPEHIFGCMLGIPHTQMARLVAVLGFDFIFVDTLHV